MMLQGICLKVEFVEFVIQILKKAAKLASEAEARRREAWLGCLLVKRQLSANGSSKEKKV